MREMVRENRVAQGLAGGFAFSALALSAWALHLGFPAFATVVAGTTLIGVVTVFLTQHRKR
ncbi:hypothetical protein EDC64_101118 [Aquabacter spiritensis]|uniref:Uncharacterized protein n=2 Tax=Aquabacter spiritensis TaxID=933073 RepID=A0A4R3M5R6_9HYPH|nr:hypothetical protein EDC64_101118 [Aquabacter spiritensis]